MFKVRQVFFLVSMFAVLTASALSASAKGSAEVTLSIDKQAITASESVIVNVTITNPNKGAIRLLKWYTPIDGVEESLFSVTRDGMPVKYIGPHYKRGEPGDRDFIILRSGESVSRPVDIADFYDLTLTGSYIFTYDVESLDLYSKSSSLLDRVGELKSEGLFVWIEGRATEPVEVEAPSAVSGSTSFTKCTTSQQSSLITARDNAADYAGNALNYLIGNNQGPRYTTWFGTYNSSRYNTVTGNFSNINSAMNNASVNFNCGCKKQYYAYVYSNQPYTIYLCRAFWTAPSLGTDSKAGTLVHEMSHFNVVAGTNDWVYGQSGARSLAISDPAKAVDNADSHEYFAENTPPQN